MLSTRISWPAPGAVLREKSTREQHLSRGTIRSGTLLVIATVLLGALLLPLAHSGAGDDGFCMSVSRIMYPFLIDHVAKATRVLLFLLVLFASKALAEVRLAGEACRKLRKKLEASFDRPSCVDSSWVRVGLVESSVGIGSVKVSVASTVASLGAQGDLQLVGAEVDNCNEGRDNGDDDGVGGQMGDCFGDGSSGGEGLATTAPVLLTVRCWYFRRMYGKLLFLLVVTCILLFILQHLFHMTRKV